MVGLMYFGLSILLGVIVFVPGGLMGLSAEELGRLMDMINGYFFLFLIICMLYFAQFSALRYRMSRTSWRGVRGNMTGSARTYMFFRIRRLFINIVTLGYMIGRTDLMARQYIVNNMFLGNQRCRFEGDITALDRVNLVTLLLAIPTLGLSRLWYRAAQLRTQWNAMHAGSISFRGTHDGASLFGLYAINILIVIFTFGFGTPVALQRTARYFADHVQILGSLEGTAILQSAEEAGTVGEGIQELFDQGFDLDVGLW